MAFKQNSKQTGTPNTKGVAKPIRSRTLLNPWGNPIPAKLNPGRWKVSGNAVRKAKPDASEAPQTKGYPANKPSQWPVIPDYANHTKTPSLSGLNSNVVSDLNKTVEQAYHRAGYQ